MEPNFAQEEWRRSGDTCMLATGGEALSDFSTVQPWGDPPRVKAIMQLVTVQGGETLSDFSTVQ